MKLVAAVLVFALGATPATGAVLIKDSPGGRIDLFAYRFRQIKALGFKVELAGYCDSACTLVTGMVPRDRVCVAPGTRLGFHSAWDFKRGVPTYSAPATRFLTSFYPADVRAMLRARGWDGRSVHPDLIKVDASKIYRPCGGH